MDTTNNHQHSSYESDKPVLVPLRQDKGSRGPRIARRIPYRWEDVVDAYQRRFPTHPSFPYIVDTQVTRDDTDGEGVRYIERIVTMEASVPSWLGKLIGVEYFHMVERSTIDPQRREMVLHTHNQTLSDKVAMWEDCIYAAATSEKKKEDRDEDEDGDDQREKDEHDDVTMKEQLGYLNILYGGTILSWGRLKQKIEEYCCNLFEERVDDAAEKEVEMIREQQRENKENKTSSPDDVNR
eukprot:gb/GECH01009234.1/.p1 GENE.gb/GECH01009234.1/~~gb/GECH01009234.1/.p1  ORF type:complete len:239 (+),score=48.48 gb/GECH01009234.1/:1-717(+)